MNTKLEYEVVDIHNPDHLAEFGEKLVIVDGKETIVEMTDDEIEQYTGELIPDDERETPRGYDPATLKKKE